jgi:hypothetical protein
MIADLIMTETRSRLLARGYTDKEIDSTRILPKLCREIALFARRREIHPFPIDMLPGFDMERVWDEEGEVEAVVTERGDQYYCAKGNCSRHFCQHHGEQGGGVLS